MFDHLAVTTFSKAHWTVYGRRFVQSFLASWNIPLYVFVDDMRMVSWLQHENLFWKDLGQDQEHEDFVAKYSGAKFNSKTDFNEMGVKFAHKVFAVTSRELPSSRWRIWIDADVEWIQPVSRGVLQDLFPDSCALTFLGRKGNLRPGQPLYTETGFVGYRTEDSRVQLMLDGMRAYYVTGAVFQGGRHNWHDAFTFDLFRKQSQIREDEQHNLSPNSAGLDAWEFSPLSLLGRHHKGLRAKLRAYGATGL